MCSQCIFIHFFILIITTLYIFDYRWHYSSWLYNQRLIGALPLCFTIYSLYTLIIYLLALNERCNFGITITLFKMQLSATLYLSTISSFHIKFYRWLQWTSNTALSRPCTISTLLQYSLHTSSYLYRTTDVQLLCNFYTFKLLILQLCDLAPEQKIIQLRIKLLMRYFAFLPHDLATEHLNYRCTAVHFQRTTLQRSAAFIARLN